MMKNLIAVDLGASSGRVILGQFQNDCLKLKEYHRFENTNHMIDSSLCWDLDRILQHIETGVTKILQDNIVPDCMAIDSWGVDFVLTDEKGNMLGNSVTYRDTRTDNVMQKLFSEISQNDIYKKTGIQFLPFNTIYQLKALIEQEPEYLEKVDTLQLIPDYLGFRLTGTKNCEYTNATTTQLVNCETGNWDEELLTKLNLNKAWFPDAMLPNRIISRYHHSATGHSFPFASIPSHDTASAILAAPIRQPNMAYLSSGTWSLIGIESLTPITHQLAQDFNVTNEGGAESRFRVLKNIMGLWIIQNVQKELGDYTFADLVSLAQEAEPFKCLINPDDLSFLNPVTMIGAIRDFCAKTHQEMPQTPGELTRCVMESLALQYRKVWKQLNTLNGEPLNGIHIVGGGSQNQLLNQMCASACNTKVYVGPVEASTIGNLCGQLIAIGEIADVEAARKMVYTSFDIKEITPLNPDAFEDQWDRFTSLSVQL